MNGEKGLLAAVLGDPVAHSLSPRLHNYWLQEYDIEGAYVPLRVPAETLAAALKDLPNKGFLGCNLTIPHKEAAIALMDEIDDAAKKIGAVNTVVIRDGKYIGSNTDAYGFAENIRSHVPNIAPHMERVLVLGAGGAARGVVVALQQMGAKHITILNRTPEKADALAKEFGTDAGALSDIATHLPKTSFLVNTSALGLAGEALPFSLNGLAASALVTDIVYHPLMTPLLQEARKNGNTIVDGLGMLIYQALPGFEAWFGKRPAIHDLAQLKEMLLA